MQAITIYHNPKCSKSRQTLAILQDKSSNINIVKYLEEPPSADVIRDILKKLKKTDSGISASDIVRKKEEEYKIAGISDSSSEDEIIKALVAFPKLLERPIVISGERAVIGRPPENVLSII